MFYRGAGGVEDILVKIIGFSAADEGSLALRNIVNFIAGGAVGMGGNVPVLLFIGEFENGHGVAADGKTDVQIVIFHGRFTLFQKVR